MLPSTARLAGVLIACLLTAPIGAQTIVTADDPAELAAIIQALGFQARLEKDGVGDPLIRSSSSGVDFSVQFYDCKNNARCQSLHFVAGYDLEDGTTLEVVEAWNEEKRFASAYLDDEDDPFLQMDLNLAGGITKANFEDTFKLWQTLKGQFETHIGFH